jgi:DNA ligase-1
VIEEAPEHLVEHSNMNPDVHFSPGMVLEVKGAEITYSPIHTCALSELKKDFGLAVRFPRFTGRFRDDKTPEDATTTQEAVSMFKNQSQREQ